MNSRILICLSALVICAAVLLLNFFNQPKYQQNEFPSASATQKVDENGKININTASAEELTQLYGIGEARAKAIIEYREFNGGFISAEELVNIDGINYAVLNRISDKITF